MKLFVFLCLALPVFAHHGQDFLVTLDTGVTDPWKFRTTFGGENSGHSEGRETSITQSLILGLPHRFSFTSVLRFADEGNGSWDSFSVTPTLQWTAPSLGIKGLFSSIKLGLAAGWEIPICSTGNHSHTNLPLQDCSGLTGIPSLYQACQQANLNAQNHSHKGEGHRHTGIHRHGESHGFFRFIAELNPSEKDRFVFNTITVFPEGDSPQFGYALAYRHRFTDKFSLGVEMTGDLEKNGEHLVYLTGTKFVNHNLSITLGGAVGLTDESPEFTMQPLLSWRF